MSQGAVSSICVDCGLPEHAAAYLNALGYEQPTTLEPDVFADADLHHAEQMLCMAVMGVE